MDTKVYRIGVFVPVLGIGGLLFFAYIALFWSGIIAWKISPKMKELSFEDDPVLVRIVVLLCAGCLFLVWTVRIKVTLDKTGIWYRGLLRSKHMRWDEIIRVNISNRDKSIHIWTKRGHLSFSTMFSKESDIKDMIANQVKQHNSDAIVENSPRPFWPRRREGR